MGLNKVDSVSSGSLKLDTDKSVVSTYDKKGNKKLTIDIKPHYISGKEVENVRIREYSYV
jgi:lipopolysaccharide export system protein LptA